MNRYYRYRYCEVPINFTKIKNKSKKLMQNVYIYMNCKQFNNLLIYLRILIWYNDYFNIMLQNI